MPFKLFKPPGNLGFSLFLVSGSDGDDILFNVLPIGCGGSVMSMLCYALLCVLSSFSIILKRKRELVALVLLSYRCLVTVNVMLLYLTVPWFGLWCVIVVFPDHTHLRFVERYLTTLDRSFFSFFLVQGYCDSETKE